MITKYDRELVAQLRKHEGVRHKPYKDTVGKLTIGVGRNLDDKGLSDEEINILLSNDIGDAMDDAATLVVNFWSLTENRQRVLVDMAFNMGRRGLSTFVNTLAAIERGDYEDASRRMLKSKWASQVGQRAITLSQMMKRG